jgi:hypothetical protein
VPQPEQHRPHIGRRHRSQQDPEQAGGRQHAAGEDEQPLVPAPPRQPGTVTAVIRPTTIVRLSSSPA